MSRPFRHLARVVRPAAIGLLLTLASPAAGDSLGAMRTALQVAAAGDWDGALSVAPEGEGRDVILWQKLRAGEGRLGDYEAFFARRPDWPGLPLMREKGEEAVTRSETPARVVAYFANQAPRTGAGAAALVAAHLALGDATRADETAMAAWSSLSLSAPEETALAALRPAALALVHDLRLDAALWEERTAEAARMLDRVDAGARALGRARIALQDGADGVTALIDAVPEALRGDPGLAFDRFRFRMRRDAYGDAATLILERSDSAASLGRPAAWAERRALLARRLMRDGEARTAYRVAARHHLDATADFEDFIDLEFVAGFVALRKLDDAETALGHFQRLADAVSTPISVSRAQYWRGRALSALGRDDEARAAYARAAAFQTAYYGLLASERLGLPLDPALLADAPGADWRQASFANSSVLAAARLLLQAGDRTLGKRFLLHLAETVPDGEMAALAELATAMNEPHVALLVAKAAAERGVILPRPYFPVPDFMPDDLAVSRALALAISRRESEFDPAARSSADARGLMQLLPDTARRMAGDLGLPYSGERLFTDPAYNATLGAAYLRRMVDEFGPSVALIASGYNAGPGRPRRWITEFGDPRAEAVDVVDWVETIPFEETRVYVMRVSEGLVVYRARLRGSAGPVNLTAELRG